jgi:hypothetical protein
MSVDASSIASVTKHTEVELRPDLERKWIDERHVQLKRPTSFNHSDGSLLNPKTSTGALHTDFLAFVQRFWHAENFGEMDLLAAYS